MSKRRAWMLFGVAVAVGATALTGCSGASDKAGADRVTLELAVIDHVNYDGRSYGQQRFVEALPELSGERIQVDVQEEWGEGAPEAEVELVKDVAAGRLDAALVSVRAFPAAGFEQFGAVEAPFTITSYAAQKELVDSPVSERLLRSLDGSGLVGIAMTVGPLRRPFAVDRPLLEISDWHGAFRVFNSPVQADAVEKLGADPVNLSYRWVDSARAGELRGVEIDVGTYADNNLTTEAGNLTSNVVLWPKVSVVIVSRATWDGLSAEQRKWITEAGEAAVEASVSADYDESAITTQLCARGVRLFDLDERQHAAWVDAVAPVVEALEASEKAGPFLRDIRVIAARHESDDLSIPAGCGGTTGVSSSLPSQPPESEADVPDGVYRVDVTAETVARTGDDNSAGWTGTWTLEVVDGTYAITCRPIAAPGTDCGGVEFGEAGVAEDAVLEAGTLRGDDSTVYFVYDAALHSELSGCALPCHPLPTQMYTWLVEGDALRFAAVPGGHSAISVTAAPWQRVS